MAKMDDEIGEENMEEDSDGKIVLTTRLKLSNQGDIVGVILGVNVTLLKDDTNSGCSLGINPSIGAVFVVVPVEVRFVVLENKIGSDRVPDGCVWEENGLFHNSLLLAFHGFRNGFDVVLSNHEHERLEVLRRSCI